ncbi:MAG: alpha/beta hydrolase [Bacteroidota bacterium]
MSFEEKKYSAKDGKEITYYHWEPVDKNQVKAVVQIVHGMAEHAQRYDRFASFLNGHGFAVFANDHRGHGKTAGSPAAIGYIEDGSFWEKTIGDMRSLHEIAKEKYGGLPHFLFGHSMGSFLTRDYIAKHGKELKGAIISATGGDPGLLGKIGLLIAKIESFFKGRKKQSPLLDTMSFGKFNAAFKPNRTEHDWLSKDEKEVDKYINDPACGTVFTTGFFIDLLYGVNLTNSKYIFETTPKELPLYLFAGALDPVGNNGKGVKEVYEKYKKTGTINLNIKLYENGRHEMLNEVNRQEVFRDILNWLQGL